MLRTVLQLLPLLILTCGCSTTTSVVRGIGVKQATLTPKNATILANGAWLIEGELEREWRAEKTFTRFIYVHPEVARREAATAEAGPRGPAWRKGARRISLEYPPCISEPGVDLLIFPPSLGAVEGSLSDHVPPGLYQDSQLRWQPAETFIVPSGPGDSVTLDLTFSRGSWIRRTALHYPAQIVLLPPAFAFDVALYGGCVVAMPFLLAGFIYYSP
ncbi:MAG: hypothetical protein AAF488_16505 [Planctomycetota bacterium]